MYVYTYRIQPQRQADRRTRRPESERSRPSFPAIKKIGMFLPNNRRRHHTLHIQKGVLPYSGQLVAGDRRLLPPTHPSVLST